METIRDLNKDTVDGLKKLARMNHDASKSFEDAAEKVAGNSYAKIFQDSGVQHARFQDELQTALAISEKDFPEGGTALGFFHRCWLNARGAIDGGDNKAMLTEVARGENSLIDAYNDVLVKTTGSPMNAVLHRQVTSIRQTHDRLESLKKAVG